MPCGALLRWSHTMLVTLQNENSDFPSKTTNGVVHCAVTNMQIPSSYPGY